MTITCPTCSGKVNKKSDNLAQCADCGKQFRLKKPQEIESTLFNGVPSQWTNLSTFISCVTMFMIGTYILIRALKTSGHVDVLIWSALSITGFLLILVSLWSAISRYIQVRYTRYNVTTDRIEIERGWISRKIDNLDLFRVKDVRVVIGIFDRMLGIGTVTIISTDATTPNLQIKGIPNARELYDKLKHASTRADKRRGVVHVEV